MATKKDIYLQANELTPDVVTNLYLYGQIVVPDSGQHNGAEVIIHMDMTEYMNNGAGSYAKLSDSPIVREFFFGLHDVPDGEYSLGDLRGKGFIQDHKIVFAHYDINKDSGDYAQRVYIYNNVSFKN